MKNKKKIKSDKQNQEKNSKIENGGAQVSDE